MIEHVTWAAVSGVAGELTKRFFAWLSTKIFHRKKAKVKRLSISYDPDNEDKFRFESTGYDPSKVNINKILRNLRNAERDEL